MLTYLIPITASRSHIKFDRHIHICMSLISMQLSLSRSTYNYTASVNLPVFFQVRISHPLNVTSVFFFTDIYTLVIKISCGTRYKYLVRKLCTMIWYLIRDLTFHYIIEVSSRSEDGQHDCQFPIVGLNGHHSGDFISATATAVVKDCFSCGRRC